MTGIDLFEREFAIFKEMFKACGFDLRLETINQEKTYVLYSGDGLKIGSIDFELTGKEKMEFSVQSDNLKLGGEFEFQKTGAPFDMPSALRNDMTYYRIDIDEDSKKFNFTNKIFTNAHSGRHNHSVSFHMQNEESFRRQIVIRPYGIELSAHSNRRVRTGQHEAERWFSVYDLNGKPKTEDQVASYSEIYYPEEREKNIHIEKGFGYLYIEDKSNLPTLGYSSEELSAINSLRNQYTDEKYKLVQNSYFDRKNTPAPEVTLSATEAAYLSAKLLTTSRVRGLYKYCFAGFKNNFPNVINYIINNFPNFSTVMEIANIGVTDENLELLVSSCMIAECNLPGESISLEAEEQKQLGSGLNN